MGEKLTNYETAKFLKCSVSRLDKGRCLGTLKIPFFKNGNRVLYDKEDLMQWLEGHKHFSTSEYATSPGPGRGHKKKSKTC